MLKVKFVGRHPVDWPGVSSTANTTESSSEPEPGRGPSTPSSTSAYKSTSTSTSTPPTITTDRQLRTDFVAYLYDRLHNGNGFNYGDDYCGRIKAADWKKALWSAIMVATDPASSITTFNVAMARACCWQPPPGDHSLDDYFCSMYYQVVGSCREIESLWGCGRGSHDDTGDEDKIGDEEKSVLGWYDEQCVLSGVPDPEAAYIMPVRITMTQHNNKLGFVEAWDELGGLWPLSQLEEKELREVGQNVANILPLNAATRRQWDRYQFALRPIPIAIPDKGNTINNDDGANTSPHRIWIQMVWLDDDAREAPSRTAASPSTGQRTPRHHGNVYEIATTDPARWPLPNRQLLEMQFHVHKLFAGMRAAAVLRDIFRDPPDGDGDEDYNDDDVPHEWRSLIDAVVYKGVLGPDGARKWKAAAAADYRWRLFRLGLAPHPDDEEDDEEDEGDYP